MDDLQFKHLINSIKKLDDKLEIMISLFAIQNKNIDDQIKILTKNGYKPRDIAGFLGLTPNAVRLRKFKKNKDISGQVK